MLYTIFTYKTTIPFHSVLTLYCNQISILKVCLVGVCGVGNAFERVLRGLRSEGRKETDGESETEMFLLLYRVAVFGFIR